MGDSMSVRCRTAARADSPCTGSYTVLVPVDREGAWPLSNVRVTGVALGRGEYQIRIERVEDD